MSEIPSACPRRSISAGLRNLYATAAALVLDKCNQDHPALTLCTVHYYISLVLLVVVLNGNYRENTSFLKKYDTCYIMFITYGLYVDIY